MKTKPEYLKFVDRGDLAARRKTRVVEVVSVSSNKTLGWIKWFGQWRQYVFLPEQGTLWNPDCLRQLASEAEKMTRGHREGLRREREAV